MSRDSAYHAFRHDQVAVLCGGAPWMQASVECAARLDVWSLDFGQNGIVTHQVVLVKPGGQWRTQDRTYGVTLAMRGHQTPLSCVAENLAAAGRRHARVAILRTPFLKQVRIRDADRTGIIPPWRHALSPTRPLLHRGLIDSGLLCMDPGDLQTKLLSGTIKM